MGLFNGYLRPGPGVEKDAPKKRGFFLYIDIIWQKMGKLVGANCLYTLTSILWIAALYLFFGYLFIRTGIVDNIAKSIAQAEGLSADAVEQLRGNAVVMLQIFFSVSVFVLWGSGPSSAAYAYVNRCFTRSEPVWVASDGWDKFKENFKQGMLVVLIDAVILILGVNALHFYYSFYLDTYNLLWLLVSYVMVLAFVVYTMMHSYIYQIMVTFECSLGAIYKNALLLSIAKLPGNALTTAISCGILYALFMVINLNPLFAAIMVFVFGLCFTRYVTDFYAARVIEKTILTNMKRKQEKAPVIEYLDDEPEDVEE